MLDFPVRGALWSWKGEGSWHFVTLSEEVTEAIRALAPDAKRDFGSVRVEVSIGDTRWKTSLFPDKKRGAYLLPIKKTVRTEKGLEPGDQVDGVITLSF